MSKQPTSLNNVNLDLIDKLPTATWCTQVLTGIAISAHGIGPCCEFTDSITGVQTVEEYRNSKKYKKLLDDMHNGVWNHGCDYCRQREKNGQISQRLHEIKSHHFLLGLDHLNPEKIYEIHDKKQYLWFNLRHSNKCNMACIMCHPYSSSLLQAEVKLHGSKHWISSDYPYAFHTYDDITNFTKHRHPRGRLYLTGGEPSIMKETIDYLDNMADTEGFELSLNTNFLAFNERFISILEKFEFVYISASIDAVGERAEYQRYLGKWTDIEYNLLKTRDRLANHKNKKIIIKPTWTMLNAWYADELAAWCNGHGLESVITNLALTVPFSITNCHDNYREELKSIFRNANFRLNSEISEREQLDGIYTSIDKNIFSVQNFQELVGHLNKIDYIRGTNYRNIFPKLHEYIETTKKKIFNGLS